LRARGADAISGVRGADRVGNGRTGNGSVSERAALLRFGGSLGVEGRERGKREDKG